MSRAGVSGPLWQRLCPDQPGQRAAAGEGRPVLVGDWAPSPPATIRNAVGTLKLRGQRVCPAGGQVYSRASQGPFLRASRAPVRPGCPHRPPPQPTARFTLRPSPAHLVGLKIIVQGELQLAQVLRLLLLLSLPLAFGQTCFCIVIVLAGGCGEKGRVARTEQPGSAQGQREASPLCGPWPSPGYGGAVLPGVHTAPQSPSSACGGATPARSQCSETSSLGGGGASLVNAQLRPLPPWAGPTAGHPGGHPGAGSGESTQAGGGKRRKNRPSG